MTAKAKKKTCSDLAPWIQSVSNHFWWCCATCNGDEQLLREKWLSVLQHVTNRHRWSGNKKFQKCSHPPMSAADKKATNWLKPKSEAFEALQKIVTNPSLLKAMAKLTQFCHTGELEVFHSVLLKFAPKRQHFSYEVMLARLMLAAYDWNNTKMEQRKDKFGQPASDVVYSKRRKLFVLRNRYTKVKTDHMHRLIQRIFDVHPKKIVLKAFSRPVGLPRNIAKVAKPTKSELREQFTTRFK